MLQDPEKKQKFERSLGQTHLLILQSFPKRKKASGNQNGNQKLTQSILGSSSHHEDTATGKNHFHSSCQLTSISTWPHWLACWHTHLGSPHAKQLRGRKHIPIFQPASCHRTHWDRSHSKSQSCPPEGPGPSPNHQWIVTNPKVPRDLQPAIREDSTQQRAGTSPGNHWAPAILPAGPHRLWDQKGPEARNPDQTQPPVDQHQS